MTCTTRALATASLATDTMPDSVASAARLHLLDALGVGLAAGAAGPLSTLPDTAKTLGAPGPSTVLGTVEGSTAPTAALINGALIHSLEYDDTHVPSITHGSSVLAAAALAEAEASNADGRQLLLAFAVGWEILVRIGAASPGGIQAHGFQTTSAAGPFAAAITSTILRGDSVDIAAHAAGIAGSQASGNFAFLAGGDTVKAAQPGWAAHAGLIAAELARGGVTGPDRVFDGEDGFYRLYTGDPSGADTLNQLIGHLGQHWYLPDAAFKLYPCCHFIHPFLECLDQVLATEIRPENVISVHCQVPAEQAGIIAEPWAKRQHPERAQQARWSLPYVLALRLVRGEVSLTDFVGDADTSVIGVAQRITWSPWRESGYPSRFPAQLTVRTNSGAEHRAEVADVHGGTLRPLPADTVITKFHRNATVAGLSGHASEEIVSELTGTDKPKLATLTYALRAQANN